MRESRGPQHRKEVLRPKTKMSTLARKDEIFTRKRLRFRLGEVVLTSRHDAENAEWEETPERSWEARVAAKKDRINLQSIV